MKNFHALLLIAFFVAGGCRSERQTAASEAADGFYVQSSKGSQLLVRVTRPSDGRIFTIPVEHYVDFVPVRIDVFDTPDGSYVQVSGRATAEGWSKQPIILIANGKPYVELGKSDQTVSAAGTSARISLITPTRAEAETVASALRKRYSL
jgi:hypothetical protein